MADTALMRSQEPALAQVGALPVRGKQGDYVVLLVTSRETKRWIIPKGWPMKGREDHEAAAQEALEEAGVRGQIHTHPMGAFTYLKDGTDLVRVMVYMLEVSEEFDNWDERDQRQRQWMSTNDAAASVDEAGLAEIIRRLDVSTQPPTPLS